jgi:uncharacterized protein
MAFLVDVNVLVALLHARHAASARAVAWLDRQEDPGSILLCRVAQMGVLRILTNPSWLKEDCRSASEVWNAWDLLLTDDRFVRVDEPLRLEAEWRRLTRDFPAGRCAETDTYFAAFASSGGYQLVTFDRGFRRFDKLDVTVLGPD